jgi:hypothetical protein
LGAITPRTSSLAVNKHIIRRKLCGDYNTATDGTNRLRYFTGEDIGIRLASREAVGATVRATGMKHPRNIQRNTHATNCATAKQHP